MPGHLHHIQWSVGSLQQTLATLRSFGFRRFSSNIDIGIDIDFDRALKMFTKGYFSPTNFGQDREPRWRGGGSTGQRHVPPL